MRIPGMTMHKISIDVRRVKISATLHCTKHGAQWFRTSEMAHVDLIADDLEIAPVEMLVAETTDFYGHCLRQFTRKKPNVNAGAAIDVRRIFISQEKRFHESPTSV